MARLLHQCAQIGILLVLLGITRPAAAQVDRFVPLADGSGVQDTHTGLIWGYSLAKVDLFSSGDQSLRDWSFTLGMGVMLTAPTQNQSATLIRYQEFSNTHFGRQDTDWRIPTRDEMVAAVDADLLLALDGSPAAGFQAFDPDSDWLWWTSTSAGRVKGNDLAYAVDVRDGSVHAFGVGSNIYGSVPVRGVAPPPPPTKGGKK